MNTQKEKSKNHFDFKVLCMKSTVTVVQFRHTTHNEIGESQLN